MRYFTPAKLKVLSGLFGNLAAGWLGAAIITPNFADLSELISKLVLTADIVFAILCLLLAFWFEEKSLV
jgi:hypothetical protein